MSSTESALVLRELYCDTYYDPIDPSADTCLGAIANRAPKEPVIVDSILNSLKEYSYLCVKEYLGITYIEYMDTTHLVREQFRAYLEPIAEEKARQTEELDTNREEIKRMSDATRR